MGRLGQVFGRSWGHLGPSWGRLGDILGRLVPPWGCLGAPLGRSWLLFGRGLLLLGASWGAGGPREAFGTDLEAIWGGCWTPREVKKHFFGRGAQTEVQLFLLVALSSSFLRKVSFIVFNFFLFGRGKCLSFVFASFRVFVV